MALGRYLKIPPALLHLVLGRAAPLSQSTHSQVVPDAAIPVRRRKRVTAIWDVAAIGLLMRFVVAPYTSVSNDVGVWYQTSLAGVHGLTLYQRPGFSYPPLWGYLLEGLGQVFRIIGAGPSSLGTLDARYASLSTVSGDFSPYVTSPLFNVAFKSLLFAGDLAAGLLVYDLVLRLTSSVHRARLAFAVWFLNPIVIFESAEHGAFDVLVGFLVLAAVSLLIQRRFFLAGAALSMGILTKGTPALLLPMLFVALLTMDGVGPLAARIRPAAERVARFGSGGLSAALVLLVPEALLGSPAALVRSVLIRSQVGISVGGLNIFSIRYWRPWEGVLSWGYYHSDTVVRLSLGLEIGVVLASVIWYFSARQKGERLALLGGTVLTFSGLLLVAPITNPGYVLWLMPALVVLAVVRSRGFWAIGMLSAGAIIYEVCILGPLAHLAPMASYTGIVSVDTIVSGTESWYLAPTDLWGAQYSANFLAIASLLAVAGLVAAIVEVVRLGYARSGWPSSAVTFAVQYRSRFVPITASWLVVGTLAVTSCAQLTAYRRGPLAVSQTSVSVTRVTATAQGMTVALRLARAPGEERLRIIGVPLSATPSRRDIVVYDDLSYPIAGSTSGSVLGVYNHVAAELAIRHAPFSVTDTDAVGLARLLGNIAQADQHIVVITTGAFPSTVLGTGRNLVRPWLEAGGTLVWGGDAIGYYSANRGEPLGLGIADPMADGPRLVLGVDALSFPDAHLREGNYPSPIAQALGIEYRQTAAGVDLARVSDTGATAMGWQTGTISSIARVPTGRGRALVFGGEVYDETVLAHDLVRILMSDALDASGPLMATTVDLTRISSNGLVQVDVPLPPGTPRATIAAFDDHPEGTFAFHETVAVPAS